MHEDTVVRFRKKEEVVDTLSELLRRGARELIGQAVSDEREVLSGIGAVTVSLPRARDRSGEGQRFRSSLVPPYVRRSKSVDAVLPWLYLKGVSTGDMREALAALVGKQATGLSAAVVSRL